MPARDSRRISLGVSGLQGYGAVVLGSAVRYSAWLPEMTGSIEARRCELGALPLAIFTMHLQALADDDASRDTRFGDTKAVRALVTPRDAVFFAGQIDLARLSFFERLAVKMVKSPVADKRDWERIRAWTDGWAQQLQ
jgi:menaquinone-dependent protoporphyrinogen oxidase